MSNYARVACRTCGTRSCRFENFNHGADRIAVALKHREVLEAFCRLAEQLEQDGTIWSKQDLIDIATELVGHEGHDVIATDEYGKESE